MLTVQGQLAVTTNRIGEGLQAAVEASASLSEWTLLAMGGTLAVVLSTSYQKPSSGWARIYVLILPALAFFGLALQRGFQVRGSHIAFLLRPESATATAEAIRTVNQLFGQQVLAFSSAVACLGIWFILYMVWWVFIQPAGHASPASGGHT